jgi:mannose-6-phosphate isomerase-like protein (cupin superfamily)
MDVRRLSDFMGFSEQKLQKHNVFQSERFFLDVYCLRPGQSQKVHAHAGSDKVYVVLDGVCRVTLGEETADLGPGMAVLARAGEPHGAHNASGADVRLLVMMAPAPPHA